MPVNDSPENQAIKMDKEAEYKAQVEKAKSETRAAKAKAKAAEKEKMRIEQDLEKTLKDLEEIEAKLEQEHQARFDAQKELEEIHTSLSAAQSVILHERTSRLEAEKAKNEIELALKETQKSLKAEAGKSHFIQMDIEKGGEQRATFVLYITFDEQGEPKRTLITHPQSSREATFPDFDTQRLSAFIQSCIKINRMEKSQIPSQLFANKKGHTISIPGMPDVNISISKVMISRPGLNGEMTLAIKQNEPFNINVHLNFQYSAAISIPPKDLTLEIKVHCQELTTGARSTLAVYRDTVLEQGSEQIVQMQVTGLSMGIYRLLTKATLHGPYRSISFYEGPIIQVLELQTVNHPKT